MLIRPALVFYVRSEETMARMEHRMARLLVPFSVLLGVLAGLTSSGNAQQAYSLGTGIADATGPAAEVTFMGYARLEQKGGGIHLRQFSRAFIFDDGERRVVFVSVDVAMISYAVRKEVLARLQILFGREMYTEQNVIVSATHTHAAPGGYNQYLLYDISVLGFVRQTFDALVTGIVRSVERAHASMGPGRLSWSRGLLLDTNINRSPTAYDKNPESERKQYEYNVDKEMVQLKMERTNGDPIGVISWFAVHPTSMNNSNTLVSSDNVGYASILFEKTMNPTALPGKGKFVAAFASSNLGDVSPNLRGPRCTDTGEACDVHSSTCDGANVLCVASGPGANMFESTRIIGERLYTKALELFEGESTQISGPIRSIHQYVNMAEKRQTVFDIQAQKNQTIRGCLPAMGYSFAAGTTDGPGAFTFIQGMTSPNELWNAVRDFLITPSAAAAECQAVKPILIPTGEMRFPFEWQPQIVSTGIAILGNFTIVAVPGEFTTMAGRRLRRAVREGLNTATSSNQESSSTLSSNVTTTVTNFTSFSWMTTVDASGNVVNVTSQSSNSSVSGANGGNSNNAASNNNMQQNMANLLSSMQQMRNGPPVVIAGLCNTYSSYIVTPQEYTLQRYEAASTIYGPHTLSLYEAQYRDLARALVTDTKVKPGPTPRDLKEDVVSLVAPVIFDSTPWNRNYGDCIKQPPATAAPGDTVSATFISGHPRNNLMLEGTFMRVERRDVREGGNATWTVVATDANWETKYKWYRTSFLLGTSESRLEWTIPEDTEPATYRIRHYGHAKYLFGGVFPYRGSSRSFQVVRRSPTILDDVTRNSKRRFFNWS